MRQAFARRRRLMVDALCHLDGLRCPTPEGAFYCLPDVSSLFGKRSEGAVLKDACSIAEALLEQKKVAVVPGEAFGAPYALRFSYACSDDAIRDGMERFTSFVEQLE